MFGGQGDKREPVKLKWKIKAVDGKIKRMVGPKKSSEEHVSKVRTIDSNWFVKCFSWAFSFHLFRDSVCFGTIIVLSNGNK